MYPGDAVDIQRDLEPRIAPDSGNQFMHTFSWMEPPQE